MIVAILVFVILQYDVYIIYQNSSCICMKSARVHVQSSLI